MSVIVFYEGGDTPHVATRYIGRRVRDTPSRPSYIFGGEAGMAKQRGTARRRQGDSNDGVYERTWGPANNAETPAGGAAEHGKTTSRSKKRTERPCRDGTNACHIKLEAPCTKVWESNIARVDEVQDGQRCVAHVALKAARATWQAHELTPPQTRAH